MRIWSPASGSSMAQSDLLHPSAADGDGTRTFKLPEQEGSGLSYHTLLKLQHRRILPWIMPHFTP